MITFENLGVTFGTTEILRGATGTIPDGAVTFLMGPNGVGKTTLIRALLGVQRHSGVVKWNGNAMDPRARHVFPVFDDDPFYDRLTGQQNLRVLAPESTVRNDQRYLSNDVLQKRVKGFSAGQRKRLSLHAALGSGASLVVLDEPTNGLDVDAQRLLRDDIVRMKSDTAFLLTGHHLDFYEGLVDHVLVITDRTVRVSEPDHEKGHDLASSYERYYSHPAR